MTRTLCTAATLFLILAVARPAFVFAGKGSNTTTKPAGAEQPEAGDALPTEAAAKPKDWYAPLKNIELGPGKLDIDLNLRTRFEYLDDFNVSTYETEDNDDLLLFRTRLGLDYHLSRDAHLRVQLQDARHWLNRLGKHDFPETCPYFDQADLREAYFEWEHIGGSPLGFKVGRQSITYADKRVFGPGDWGNVGRYWWDALKLYIDTEPAKIDVLYGQRIISEPTDFNDRHFDFDMLGLYAQIKKLPCKLDLFYTLRYDDHGGLEGEYGEGDEQTHTLGLHLDGKIGGNWDYGGMFAWQFGEFGRDDVEAYAVNARLGYTFDLPWKPRIGAEFNYASGDRDPGDGKHQTFDTIFGAMDLYYGRMNLVSWKNLQDYQITFGVEPMKDLKLWADYHFLRLDSDTDAWYWASGKPARRDRTGGSGQELGQEIDLLAQWKITRNLELFAGYAYFMPGGFIHNTPGSQDDADWAFIQLTYSF